MNAHVPVPFNHDAEPQFKMPIQDYSEFYRFYLTEHRSIMSRRLHATGSSIGIYFFSRAIRQRKAK